MQIIIPYFNYTASPTRRANLDKVINQVKDYPHLVCCFCDEEIDAPTLTFDHGAMVWQKERLINLGFQASDTDAVMYMDADCIFNEDNWYDQICKSLEQHSVVQCFGNYRYDFDDRTYFKQGAIADYLTYGRYTGASTGGAWAFRTPAPLHYEHALVGGGDTIFCDWLLGHSFPHFLSRAQLEHHREWSKSQTPPRDIGYVPLHATFLPCGTFANRKYAARHQVLKNFSPLDDTFITKGELIQMPNKALELKILDYIMQRDA